LEINVDCNDNGAVSIRYVYEGIAFKNESGLEVIVVEHDDSFHIVVYSSTHLPLSYIATTEGILKTL